AADHSDAGIAVAPQIMIHEIRRAAVQIALLPPRQRHPQAGAVKARRLAADHDRDGGITALDQRLGALLVWPHDARSLEWRLVVSAEPARILSAVGTGTRAIPRG